MLALLLTLGMWLRSSGDAARDIFGGALSTRATATGYFHVERVAGRSWLVTPAGHGITSGSGLARIIAYEPVEDKGEHFDLFAPSFEEIARRAARRLCRPRVSDRSLVGYLVGSNLDWASTGVTLLDRYLAMPEESPGRRRAEAFLEERGCRDGTPTQLDEEAFAELAAAEYFRVCRDAIRASDRNHLVMAELRARELQEPLVRSMFGRVDLIRLLLTDADNAVTCMRKVYDLAGVPVLAMVELSRTHEIGSGTQNPGQSVTSLLQEPGCVGVTVVTQLGKPDKDTRIDRPLTPLIR